MRLRPTESIFARMTALAQAHGALNLAQGLMWLDPDPALLQIARDTFTREGSHQYSLPTGDKSLRMAVAALSEHFFGVSYDPEQEITLTAGATEGIFTAIMGLTQPGDHVLFFEPAYDSYLPAIQMAGATPVPIRLHLHPEGVRFPWEALPTRIDSRTRLLLLNFPHNPTGRTLHPEDVRALEGLAAAYPHLLFVVDEAYELMTWHPDPLREEAVPPLSLRQSPVLRERTVVVGSLGKLVGATGWRLGYLLAPPTLTEALRTTHQFITFCAPTPLQQTVAQYLSSHLPERATYFHQALLERRRFFVEQLQAHTDLAFIAPEGAYFLLLRIPSPERDTEAAERLAREGGVATIPLSPFYHDGYDPGWLRVCLARPLEMLQQGALRLSRAFPAGQSTAHPRE